MTDGNESMNPYFFKGQDVNGESHIDCGRGLTKREYFAAMVLQGMVSNPSMLAAFADKFEPTEVSNHLSKAACDAADKLIEALNK